MSKTATPKATEEKMSIQEFLKKNELNRNLLERKEPKAKKEKRTVSFSPYGSRTGSMSAKSDMLLLQGCTAEKFITELQKIKEITMEKGIKKLKSHSKKMAKNYGVEILFSEDSGKYKISNPLSTITEKEQIPKFLKKAEFETIATIEASGKNPKVKAKEIQEVIKAAQSKEIELLQKAS